MRFSTTFASALALLPFGATALQNPNGPFVLKLEEESIQSVKNNLLADVGATVFNGLSQPLEGVVDGLGVIVCSVLDLLGNVVGTVFYLTEDGKLYIEGTDPAAAAAGFSVNGQGQLLYKGEQLQAGFEGDNFKLKPKEVVESGNNKRDLLGTLLGGLLGGDSSVGNDPITLNTFIPVSVDALDWKPAAPFVQE